MVKTRSQTGAVYVTGDGVNATSMWAVGKTYQNEKDFFLEIASLDVLIYTSVV